MCEYCCDDVPLTAPRSKKKRINLLEQVAARRNTTAAALIARANAWVPPKRGENEVKLARLKWL
jgi:hypothetical protein